MKDIRLKRLVLQNFQGEKHFVFELDSKNANVYGYNETGKTRLASAFSWLLFGKDSLGRADFEIKNKNALGEIEHGLEHTVEGILSINNTDITLKKVYKEKWTKQRGKAKATFTGHTTDYFIDGIPVKEKEYKEKISEIAGDEETFRLITNPTVFPSLHWRKQREILINISGDVSNEDIFEADPELETLRKELQNRTLNQYREILQSTKRKLNKELDKIPVRIDEVKKSMPDIENIDEKELKKELKAVEAKINDISLQIQGFKTTGKIAELTKEKAQIENKISQHLQTKEEERDKISQKINEINMKIAVIKTDIHRNNIEISTLEENIRRNHDEISAKEKEIEILRNLWLEEDKKEFSETICSYCNQPLPQDKLEKLREDFNLKKAETLRKIEDNGRKIKGDISKIELAIKSAEKEISQKTEENKKLSEEIYKQEELLKLLQNSQKDLEPPEIKEFKKQIEKIEKKIEKERELKEEDILNLQKEKSDLEWDRKHIKETLDTFQQKKKLEKRIDELMAEEKQLGIEYEKIEQELYLVESFEKTKANLLTWKINAVFKMTRFKLFNVLVNGAIEPTCEITVDGIGYNEGLNNAAKIQAGCDIINALQEYYRIKAPVWIDNRESVIDLPEMNCQLISLIVSKEDKRLRVEVL